MAAHAQKVDYKRELRELYAPEREPSLVEVPELSFLMIDGRGDPNTSAAYKMAIEALYSVSYTAKFASKKASRGSDFTVMPLEGLWWVGDGSHFMPDLALQPKSAWSWTAMIMQPPPVTLELVENAREILVAKKRLPALDLMRFEPFDEGLAAQVMHIGPYAEEGPTIARLHEFIADRGFIPAGKHHEIYLGDPRRTAPERLKTVVRQPVAPAGAAFSAPS